MRSLSVRVFGSFGLEKSFEYRTSPFPLLPRFDAVTDICGRVSGFVQGVVQWGE